MKSNHYDDFDLDDCDQDYKEIPLNSIPDISGIDINDDDLMIKLENMKMHIRN